MNTRTTPMIAPGTWTVDPAHSSVEFSVKHMGIANVRGRFTKFEGVLEVGENLADSQVRGALAMMTHALARVYQRIDHSHQGEERAPRMTASPWLAPSSTRAE